MTRSLRAPAMLTALALASCQAPASPRLTVELTGAPVAEAILVNVHCVAGWILNVPLRIRAADADMVSMDTLYVRADDAGTRALLGQLEVELGGRALGEAGAGLALDVPVRLTLVDEVGAPPTPFPVVVSGVARGRAADGSVHASYRLDAVALVVIPPPRDGNACSAAP